MATGTGFSDYKACSISQFLKEFVSVPAAWPAAYTPTYSNAGYNLLGLVLERITGLELSTLMQQSISAPLNATTLTYYAPMDKSHAVIPVNDSTAGFSVDLGASDAAGGYYSSMRDLAAVGQAILNSTLLAPAKTRRWLKPRTFTTAHNPIGGGNAVGMPFEIYTANSEDNIVEMYTKAGDFGAYHSWLIMVPSYGVTLTIMTASPTLQGARDIIAALFVDIVLPGIKQATKEEANAHFAGTYTLRGHNATNTTIEISTDRHPGLRVSKFISAGHDQLAFFAADAKGRHLDLRLFPNELYNGVESKRVGFTGASNYLPTQQGNSPFLTGCGTWVNVDIPTRGSLAVFDFDFEVDGNGYAVGVHSKGYRMTLDKV